MITPEDRADAICAFKVALMQSGIDRDTLVYDLADDEIIALCAAAERRAYENAAEVAYTICAKTRHVALGDEIAQAIHELKGTE